MVTGPAALGELSSVANSYAANTNKLSLSKPVRSVRLLAVGSGQMLFMVPKSTKESAVAGFAPATDLADATKRYKMVALAAPQQEYRFTFDHPVQDFYFLTASGNAAVYATGYDAGES